jgi:thioredoxin-related protein
MRLKHIILYFTALLLIIGFSAYKKPEAVPELIWYTDLNQVHQISQKTKKPIFGFFTGSDWCGWCMKLQRDVFAKDAFKIWANKYVVLLELDFPRKNNQSAELRQQNQNLAQGFQVQGYPKVWLFTTVKDSTKNHFNISPYGSLGYPVGATPGSEEVTFLNTANGILGIK